MPRAPRCATQTRDIEASFYLFAKANNNLLPNKIEKESLFELRKKAIHDLQQP